MPNPEDYMSVGTVAWCPSTSHSKNKWKDRHLDDFWFSCLQILRKHTPTAYDFFEDSPPVVTEKSKI